MIISYWSFERNTVIPLQRLWLSEAATAAFIFVQASFLVVKENLEFNDEQEKKALCKSKNNFRRKNTDNFCCSCLVNLYLILSYCELQ